MVRRRHTEFYNNIMCFRQVYSISYCIIFVCWLSRIISIRKISILNRIEWYSSVAFYRPSINYSPDLSRHRVCCRSHICLCKKRTSIYVIIFAKCKISHDLIRPSIINNIINLPNNIVQRIHFCKHILP